MLVGASLAHVPDVIPGCARSPEVSGFKKHCPMAGAPSGCPGHAAPGTTVHALQPVVLVQRAQQSARAPAALPAPTVTQGTPCWKKSTPG